MGTFLKELCQQLKFIKTQTVGTTTELDQP